MNTIIIVIAVIIIWCLGAFAFWAIVHVGAHPYKQPKGELETWEDGNQNDDA